MIRTLIRSGMASLMTAALELSSLALLDSLDVPLVVAFAAVQIVGIMSTFTLNKLFVFRARKSGRLATETWRSVPVFGGAFVLNTLLPSFGANQLHMHPIAAYIVGQVLVYAAWSFPLNRWWVFPARVMSDTGWGIDGDAARAP
jgi:putative flippase GtrA